MSANKEQVGNTNEFVSINIVLNGNAYHRIGTDCINTQEDLDKLINNAVRVLKELRITDISGWKPLGGA